jgi:lysophospholipid acyltransferase (LPLAT)-like uncharacterized protein
MTSTDVATKPETPPLKLRLIGWILAHYIRLVFYSSRWTWENREYLREGQQAPRIIAATWHARLAPIFMLRPYGRRAVALISANRDGAFLAAIMRAAGVDAVRGSSRDPRKPDKAKGGAAATPKLVEACVNGAAIVITPDGPRGPAMRCKPGAAVVSATAESPVLPIGYSVRRALVLKTWDRFMIPWPFNRGAFVFGPLIEPATEHSEAMLDAKRREIEAALLKATRRADALVGRETPPQGAALNDA